MSWSISTELKNEKTDMFTDNKLKRLKSIDRSNIGNQHCVQERDEQIDAAMQAVASLLIAGGFIENSDEISISMSGHANKNHNKDDSWSNEFVNINIGVKSYREGG